MNTGTSLAKSWTARSGLERSPTLAGQLFAKAVSAFFSVFRAFRVPALPVES